MTPVPIHLFAELQFPCQLSANSRGDVAFITRKADMAKNNYNKTLWLLQEGQTHRLTEPGGLSLCKWLDDDRLLLAKPLDDGLGGTLLQTLALNVPGEAQTLACLRLEVEDAAALPSGNLLLLARENPHVEHLLEKHAGDAEKAAAELKEENDVEVLCELPFWEDGDGFVRGQRRRLFLLQAGKAPQALTSEEHEIDGFWLSPCRDAVWYTARRRAVPMPLDNRLYHLCLGGGNPVDVTPERVFLHSGVAPLSQNEAVVAGSDMKQHGFAENPCIYRVTLAGGGAAAQPLYTGGEYGGANSIATDMAIPAEAPWQALGNAVYWVSTLNEGSHVMRLNLSTGQVEQATKQAGAVQEFALCGGGLVVAAQRGLAAPELYRVAPDGSETPLTTLNANALKDMQLATPMPLAHTNAAGTEIRGFVLKPPGLATGQKCPAILNIHGGPHMAYGPVLFHEMQYWAGQGFAVVFCNPTGGDGRGNAFLDIRGNYGQQDYDDLMGFLDTAIDQCHFIDTERLGVTGGSYGGFMTNWIIGHTQRFKAAVSQRSISNWFSMAAMSDIGYFFEPYELGATMWDNPEAVWQQSPLKYAHKVTTPTLFLHSSKDYRCPAAEGLQMYGALAAHGVPTRLCLFRGESHNLSRSGRPKQRKRRLEEITAWFKQHLCT